MPRTQRHFKPKEGGGKKTAGYNHKCSDIKDRLLAKEPSLSSDL
jgi:hypothetical protein